MHILSLLSILVPLLCVSAKKPEKSPRRHLQANDDDVGDAPRRAVHRNINDNFDDLESDDPDSEEGFVCRWWNWLFGGKSCKSSGNHSRQPERKKRVREWRNEELFEIPGQGTVTVTVTVTVTREAVEGPMKQQNARRQEAFNDWFNQDDVKRSAKKEQGE
jgi:hypothetical protein